MLAIKNGNKSQTTSKHISVESIYQLCTNWSPKVDNVFQ